MRNYLIIIVLFVTGWAWGQESELHADFRGESERFHANCFESPAGCALVLFTDHPLHIAVGSIAPQNGFGAGLAFVSHKTPNERWRLSWSLDAIGSTNTSWRAGGYMKIIHTPVKTIRPVTTTTSTGSVPKSNLGVHEYTVFNLYAQTTSLRKIYFFGLGPDSPKSAKSVFGLGETIIGGNAVVPVYNPLKISLTGEINGRIVDVRGNHDEESPSIETVFNNVSAPGLNRQPGFAQFGEGIRIRPSFFNNFVRLNYQLNFQQFIATSDSTNSFRRLTVDLSHEFPLYRTVQSTAPRDFNGPNECATGVGEKCPSVSTSVNRSGTIGLRFFLAESIAPAGHIVPFYFQPTLGGSDINGNMMLASFEDYRFRAPNVMLLRESFEHSIYGPIGFTFAAEQGSLGMARGDLGDRFKHSYSTGLTLRAGGFPQVLVVFAWGGEASHTIANINTSLLGGSRRPSLY
jgi:hypothetical protein